MAASYPLRRGDMSLTWLANSADTNAFDFEITSPVEAIHAFGVVSPQRRDLDRARRNHVEQVAGRLG